MRGGSTRTAERVLWLTADKSAEISVGRERIADYLVADAGYEVTLRGTTPRTVAGELWDPGGYDVVVGTTRAGAIAGTTIRAASGTPLVVDHVDPIRQFEATHPRPLATAVRQLENLAFAVADHVCYVYAEEGPRVRRYARATTRTALGVEFDRFAEPDSASVAAAESRLDALGVRENVAVYVGGLEPIYHVEVLLDAAAHLDDWTVVLVGTGSLEGEVARRAARSGGVEYLGTVPHEDVPGYLHAADVGVCLVDDPHTLKVLEYLAAGLPVVQHRGRAEGRFGDLLTYTEPSPAAIAAAIRSAGTEVGRADRERGRAFAERFDWRAVAETYREVIESVTGKRREEPWATATSSS